MQKKIVLGISLLMLLQASFHAQVVKTNYVNAFDNVNHPEVAYWFFASNMMPEDVYKRKIDSFAAFSKYTLIFLTERNGCNFYDIKTMHPIFEMLVAYAHQKGLKIGLQIWKRDFDVKIENTDRLVQEKEIALDKNGKAVYTAKGKNARNMKDILKSELLKVYAFKKIADGIYDSSTLKDITHLATFKPSVDSVKVSINAGNNFKGYTVYILTQHYYNSCSNFSTQAKEIILNAFKAYGDIPFDGVGLDEYKNMTIARQPVLEQAHDVFRERLYSLGMATKMKATTGMDLDRVLFDMRYSPGANIAVRMKAINTYMSLLRTATLEIEAAMYDLGKQLHGKNTFIGLHDTFHNNLDGDEVWQTGVSWWNIKRDYGHTDEEISTPIQLGIGMTNRMNAMYNMYFNKSLDRIWTKALYDLRFGVRTHYHAANDVQGWGVSIDAPEALQKINKVENAARMLNRFDPPFPDVKLLVVYGMEALYDWFPNYADRGLYDVNDKLKMEKKTKELWENGYLNAAVPTDLIEDGRLKLNAVGKPVLNGHVFDAIIFMGPEYSKAVTVNFFQNYVNKGGKLLIDGNAFHDYNGKNIYDTWKKIADKAVAVSYSLSNAQKLGVKANELKDGVSNGNGEYTFTSIESLQNDASVIFSFTDHGNTFTGTYKGLAAIQVDNKGNIIKLSATALGSISKNGKEIFHLTQPADIFISTENKTMNATIADATKSIKIVFDK